MLYRLSRLVKLTTGRYIVESNIYSVSSVKMTGNKTILKQSETTLENARLLNPANLSRVNNIHPNRAKESKDVSMGNSLKLVAVYKNKRLVYGESVGNVFAIPVYESLQSLDHQDSALSTASAFKPTKHKIKWGTSFHTPNKPSLGYRFTQKNSGFMVLKPDVFGCLSLFVVTPTKHDYHYEQLFRVIYDSEKQCFECLQTTEEHELYHAGLVFFNKIPIKLLDAQLSKLDTFDYTNKLFKGYVFNANESKIGIEKIQINNDGVNISTSKRYVYTKRGLNKRTELYKPGKAERAEQKRQRELKSRNILEL